MPTGNTEIIENGGSFKEYLLKCATGFFYDCADLNQIPTIENSTTIKHHREGLEAAQRNLDRAKVRTEYEWQQCFDVDNANNLAMLKEGQKSRQELRVKYTNMRKQCEAWIPPTPNHNELKQYMLDQIDLCAGHIPKDDYDELIAQYKTKTVQTYKSDTMANYQWRIDYHTKKLVNETASAEMNQKWIAALRDCIKDLQ
jgi:hypothetical protein